MADDAVELIAVDYEPLVAVADITSALAPDAPAVHDYIENNIVFEGEQKPDGFDAVFDTAERILEGEFTTARVAVVSMETRGCVASFDRRRGALTVLVLDPICRTSCAPRCASSSIFPTPNFRSLPPTSVAALA